MRTRDNKITVYMNDQELARLNALVDKTNLNREQFIRAMVEGLTIKEAPPAPLWQTVCRMKRAAVDIKKIADNAGSEYVLPWTRQACLDAYRRAGLTVDDIDVFETHDCFSSSESPTLMWVSVICTILKVPSGRNVKEEVACLASGV